MIQISINRLLSISDGIIAIALTLLLLNLIPPAVNQSSKVYFLDIIYDVLPEIFSYIICFWSCMMQWVLHHLIYHDVKMISLKFVWLNFIWLFFLTLLPVFTLLMYDSNGLVFTYVFHVFLIISFLLSYLLLLSSRNHAQTRLNTSINYFIVSSLSSMMVTSLLAIVGISMFGLYGLSAWFFYGFFKNLTLTLIKKI
ncbi:MAG: TMEM175 family protein [Pseudomonadota bacterium]|nr:TMEM175 family protein [Pseudomonadota bacterium]